MKEKEFQKEKENRKKKKRRRPGQFKTAMEATKLALLVVCAFVAILPTLGAHIADFDEDWKKRAEEARKATLEAYHPNPYNVTDHLNHEVHK